VDDRVVQVDRKSGKIRNAEEVQKKFGVPPASIADYLALVGDSADGYPGLRGFGPKTAADVISRFHHIEEMPDDVLKGERKNALLFKKLATLVHDAPLFASVDELEWQGPTADFEVYAEKMGDKRIVERAQKAAGKLP
jgi:5'-3' exonuclease